MRILLFILLLVNVAHAAGPRLFLEGDSQTAFEANNRPWPWWFTNVIAPSFVSFATNGAESGRLSEAGYLRYTTYYQPYGTFTTNDFYLLNLGTVDYDEAFGAVPWWTTLNNLSNTWKLAKTDGMTVVAFTIPPAPIEFFGSGAPGEGTHGETNRLRLNRGIRLARVSGQYHRLVDLDAYFNTNHTSNVVADLLHWTTNSHRRIAQFVYDSVFAQPIIPSWVDPIGYPPLPWGSPTQTVANTYGHENYFTYWINRESGNATDANNTYGNPTKPRATIPEPIVLLPGDVMHIEGSNYWDVHNIASTATRAWPAFVTGTNGWPASTNLTKFGQAKSRDYSSSNLVFQCLDATILLSPADSTKKFFNHAYRFGTYIRTGLDAPYDGGSDAAAFSIGVTPAVDSVVGNIVVLSNKVDWFGDWRSIQEGDWSGIYTVGMGTNLFYIGNEISHTSGDGIAGGANAANSARKIYIGYNHIYRCRENAIDIKALDDFFITQNVLWGFTPPETNKTSYGEAVILHEQPKTNAVFSHNVVSNCHMGLVAIVKNMAVVGNTFSDIHWVSNTSASVFSPTDMDSYGAAIWMASGSGTNSIVNNTITNCDIGIKNSSPNATIANNIISGCPSNTSIYINNSDSGAVGQFNLIHNPSGRATNIWSGTAGDVAVIAGVFGADFVGNKTNAPMFSTFPALQSSSPAVNGGTNVNFYTEFEARTGQNTAFDIVRTARPVAGKWDIGVYESVSVGAPAAPTSLAALGGNQSVSLSWLNPDALADGIHIRGENYSGGGNVIEIDLAPGSTSYNDTGLANDVARLYTVSRTNSVGSASDSVTATPTAGIPPNGRPRKLRRFTLFESERVDGEYVEAKQFEAMVQDWPAAFYKLAIKRDVPLAD